MSSARLRPTMLFDLDFVISVEQDPANRLLTMPWDRTQPAGAIRFPDFCHLLIEAGDGYPSAGFVILRESVCTADGDDSLVVMAILRTEHAVLHSARQTVASHAPSA